MEHLKSDFIDLPAMSNIWWLFICVVLSKALWKRRGGSSFLAKTAAQSLETSEGDYIFQLYLSAGMSS